MKKKKRRNHQRIMRRIKITKRRIEREEIRIIKMHRRLKKRVKIRNKLKRKKRRRLQKKLKLKLRQQELLKSRKLMLHPKQQRSKNLKQQKCQLKR